MQRLSSGYKINASKDNAAGLAIARKMNQQIRALQQANDNANDGISILNTADGAMSEMHDILQRMNELSVQAANGTASDSDREQIQLEIDQMVEEIDRIAATTQFNAQNLLDGTFAYRAYTNAENVQVTSYSDGVQKGIYAIDSLTYYHYEDTVTTFKWDTHKVTLNDGKTVSITRNKTVKSVEDETRYQVKSTDDVQKALMGSASISAYKTASPDYKKNYEQTLISGSTEMRAFDEGVRVTTDGDDIILKGNNDFEVKINLNSKTTQNVNTDKNANTPPIINTPVTTTSSTTITKNKVSNVTTQTDMSVITTTCYRNITVQLKGSEKRYNITELNFAEEVKDKNKVAEKTGKDADGEGTAIYSTSRETGLSGLEEDFAEYFDEKYHGYDISVESITYDSTAKTFSIEISAADKRTGAAVKFNTDGTIDTENAATGTTDKFTLEFSLFEGKDENGKPVTRELEDYHYSTTKTTKTKYTIGEAGNLANSLTLDLTGMGPMQIQIGANAGQVIAIEIPAVDAYHLGIDDLDVTTEDKATAAIDMVGKAINQLSTVRAKIGAYTNRMEHTITNLNTSEEKMTESYSRIMDVDMAEEMTDYSTAQVLVQAATSVLAQANERPQQVLQLLQ